MASKFVDVELEGNTWCMPVTYLVSKKVNDTVGDPLAMTLQASGGRMPWSTEQIIDILHIGVNAAGAKMTRQQVAEGVFERGSINFLATVAKFITSLVEGSPERSLPENDSPKG